MVALRRATGAVANALSFSRAAMRELVRGRWRVEKVRIDLDEEGRGEVLYRLVGHGWVFHFFLVSTRLPEELKLDRNFAQSWDAMGVLCQGDWTPEREAYLRREVPKQRAGRADYDTLIYARGNRSGRLFEHVVESLAACRQPDAAKLAEVGYVLRTTAFIGNGQLGTRPLAGFEPDHPMRRPYHAQMWSGFLLREYVFDLIDHLARVRNPAAASLDPAFRRYLGLGNSAATGLVPFIVNHPLLIHHWLQAYETASSEARSRPVRPDEPSTQQFESLLAKATRYFEEGSTQTDIAFSGNRDVARELARVADLFNEYRTQRTVAGVETTTPWQAIHEELSRSEVAEATEVFSAILLELYPEIVDRHSDGYLVDERLVVDPAMTLPRLKEIVQTNYSWVFREKDGAEDPHYFWYRSTQAPRDLRRGLLNLAPELEAETAMDVASRVRALLQRLNDCASAWQVADLLAAHPELRHIVARVQTLAKAKHGELQVDFQAKHFSPFAPIRFVLAFFGMEKFESALPKSVRGAFMQGAPIAEDVERGIDGVWPFPLAPGFKGRDEAALPPLQPAPLKAPPVLTAEQQAQAPSGGNDFVVVAPIELLRLLYGALQAAGLELGAAEEAAEMVLFAEGLFGGAVPSLLRQLERDGMRRQPAAPRRDDRMWVQDALGQSALAFASTALDMACARALTKGSGLSLVLHADGPENVCEIARRCAERGLLGLLLWHGEQPGLVVAGPGQPEPWMIRAEHRAPSLFFQKLSISAGLAGASAQVDDLLAATPGFMLLCRDPANGEVPTDVGAWQQIMRDGGVMSMRSWYPDQMEQERKGWHRHGLRMSTVDFDALTKAAAKLFVPEEQEHRLRPDEGTDPLKVF